MGLGGAMVIPNSKCLQIFQVTANSPLNETILAASLQGKVKPPAKWITKINSVLKNHLLDESF